jgi:hypothetical protein
MRDEELNQFDDPELKAALKRALGAEKAPELLRARIAKLLAEPRATDNEQAEAVKFVAGRVASEDTGSKPVRIGWVGPAWGLAVAAMLVVSIGLLTLHLQTLGRKSTEMPALPVAFADALVTRHDICCALPDHHILNGVPDDDFRLMTQKLRERLGFPALAVAAGDGWQFKGASASCRVGDVRSAHLVFKKNDESLSIFSIAVAAESWPDGTMPADGDRFANVDRGHAIMSWVHDNTVYSVVGYGTGQSPELRDIAPVVDKLRLAIAGETGVENTAFAAETP